MLNDDLDRIYWDLTFLGLKEVEFEMNEIGFFLLLSWSHKDIE